MSFYLQISWQIFLNSGDLLFIYDKYFHDKNWYLL